ncbi:MULTISPECIES: EI24 domain-containing protein [Cetobacterium]|uniref:EI24 domain-containing protein n=1 Tax=Candidatus Cetobacterium colombiensis TaxID=3073100 RepID=A0ABU4W7E6_9FUSO|nr:EI24 domain-containing protein [Candidatus Cetobacterium colombiensis]MDX8335448.1 EI24 domain-containing protein [Candidatus Cetobacterium colombiensis]
MKKIKFMLESYLEAHKIIKELKLTWGYFIGGLVGIIILLFFYWISSYVGSWIFEKLNLIFRIQKYAGLLKWIIIFIIRVIMVSIEYFFFKAILLGILAPFFSYISEKVENYKEGTEYNFTFKDNIKFILRGLKIASKSFFKEMIYTLIAIVLGIVPIVNIFVPVLIFIIQSYFISYNFVDYTLERRKYSAEESLKFMKENRITFILGGAIFTIIYFIPIIGIIIGPVISIVAFTTTTLKILNLKNANKE